MVAFINALVWELVIVIGNLQLQEYSAESITSTRNMMTLQGTVRELKNNTENGTIKEVEKRAYGDNINIYVYNNITRTPPWTDNAIPIHNHDGAGYSYISLPIRSQLFSPLHPYYN